MEGTNGRSDVEVSIAVKICAAMPVSISMAKQGSHKTSNFFKSGKYQGIIGRVWKFM
jgi:hypothetical protein